MSSLILPKKFQHIHRVMNTNIDGNRMIPFAMKIPSTSLYTPLLCQKRCCSSNTPQEGATYSLKELIKSVQDSQKELFKHVDDLGKLRHDSLKESIKHVDDSVKLRHDSLRSEFQAQYRALMLHMRIMIGLFLLSIGGILAREWIASGFLKPKSDGQKEV